jgi:hypothetical protein
MPKQKGVTQTAVRAISSFVAVGLLLVLPLVVTRPAEAAVSYVQGTAAIATSVSLGSNATAGNLLVVVCGTNANTSITGPGGYTPIISESGAISQAMFYKFATGSELSGIGCSFGGGTPAVEVMEYSGIHTYSTVETSASANGSSTSISTGSLTTTHANDLLIAAATSNIETTISWNSPFTARVGDSKTNGPKTGRDAISGGDRIVSAGGTYSATASAGNADWRGQIVAFRAMANSPALTFDFVDAGGGSVSSPGATLGSTSPTFTCQTVTGTLGGSSQRLRVTNMTDNPSWTVTMAATGGAGATWSSPGPPPHSYKFNDSAGSGCTNGQLTVNPAAGTLSAQSGCTTNSVAKGSSTAFVSSTAATIMNASSPAQIDCYWELINIGLSQKIPPGQLGGNYTINMTLTITAS